MKIFVLSCLNHIIHFLLKFVSFLLGVKSCQLFIKRICMYFRAQLLIPELNALFFNDVIALHPVFSWVIFNTDRTPMRAVDAWMYELTWTIFVHVIQHSLDMGLFWRIWQANSKSWLRYPKGNVEGWGQCFGLCIHHVPNTIDWRCPFPSKRIFLNIFLDI